MGGVAGSQSAKAEDHYLHPPPSYFRRMIMAYLIKGEKYDRLCEEVATKDKDIERLKEIIGHAIGGIDVFIKDIEAVRQTLEQALKGD